MSLLFEKKLSNRGTLKIAHTLFYVLLVAIGLLLYLFMKEQDNLKKVTEKMIALQGLESQIRDLEQRNVTLAEENRVKILSREKVFANWYDYANWLEVLRGEAKKREIEFRYSFDDTPASNGELTRINCRFALTSEKEGYSRFISFISFVCDIKEYQIVMQRVSMVKGETAGIKECVIQVYCWIER